MVTASARPKIVHSRLAAVDNARRLADFGFVSDDSRLETLDAKRARGLMRIVSNDFARKIQL